MPANMTTIPISDSIFGRKSAIHQGVTACQLTIDGWPVTKYPKIHNAVPASEIAHPITTRLVTVLFNRRFSLYTECLACIRIKPEPSHERLPARSHNKPWSVAEFHKIVKFPKNLGQSLPAR